MKFLPIQKPASHTGYCINGDFDPENAHRKAAYDKNK